MPSKYEKLNRVKRKEMVQTVVRLARLPKGKQTKDYFTREQMESLVTYVVNREYIRLEKKD